ncbi:response regulator [Spirosoma sp. BT702]|uniref:Response regulator n=1 Tax=Spirosoma profusum TaxID=2771354 RepID=A0A927AUA8_9BACT|nr:response regulator [Spirosoma profusum]MBD2703332.1 response regulator [Spirosoma profusum]
MSGAFPILVVDDEAHVADILNRAAINSFPEAKFTYVSSFKEAVGYLDGLRGVGPKLVLLDLDLKSTPNGLDFLSLIRHHPQGRLIPVVILSSHATTENRDEAIMRGATAFTVKPFSFADWKKYVTELRIYWFQTVTIPKLYFDS